MNEKQTLAPEDQEYFEQTKAIRSALHQTLKGKRVDADSLAEAMTVYYPDYSFDRLREICREMEAGVQSGKKQAETVFSQPPEDLMPNALDEMMHGMDEAEQRRFLKIKLHELLVSARVPMTTEMCINLDRMQTGAIKQKLIDVACEQGAFRAQKLFEADQMQKIAVSVGDDKNFTTEENDLIETAVHCAANKLKEAREARKMGGIIGGVRRVCARIRSAWEDEREKMLTDDIPTFLGAMAGYVGCTAGLFALLELEKLPWMAVVCQHALYPLATVLWHILSAALPGLLIGIAAFALGRYILKRIRNAEAKKEIESIHSQVLKDLAGDLSAPTEYTESDVCETDGPIRAPFVEASVKA